MATVKTKSVEAALPHGHHTASWRVATHVASEFTNDVEQIMPTVSSFDRHFAMPAPAGDHIDLMLANTEADVRNYYISTRKEWNVLRSNHLRTLDAPWYSLHDSVGELHIIATNEDIVGARATVLFPVWTDGIIGEIVWPQPAWSKVDARSVTDVELENMRLHDRYLKRWRAGDVNGMVDLFEEVTCSVVRIVELGGDNRVLDVARTKDDLRRQFSAPEAGRMVAFELTNLALSHFYVFSAYRYEVELPDRRVERELASLWPVGESGRFVGQLAYGFEVRL
jgi:hypothetical protein